jgi:fructoselysine 6-kinase
MKMQIATVGDNCIDYYDDLNIVYYGGNPVNVAVYLSRLGERASYTGVVGDDPFGAKMIKALKNKNVDVSHCHTAKGLTAVTHVKVIDGERVFGEYIEGVLENFHLTDDDVDFLCRSDMVVSGIWGKVENDLGRIRARGVPIAFDFSDQPNDPIVKKAISNVDYAFFAANGEDSPVLREFMKRQQSFGPKCVTVTLGDKGSLAYDGKEFYKFGIIPCKVVDTMGAGDSYIAGFLQGILLGEPVLKCMEMGAACSSETLQYQAAW